MSYSVRQPAPTQLAISFDFAIDAEQKDWRIVEFYMEVKSVRRVAIEMELSRDIVRAAIDRFRGKMKRERIKKGFA